MYRPDHFDIPQADGGYDIIRRFGFGLLITPDPTGRMVASHQPLHLDVDGPSPRLLGHVARANDQWEWMDGERESLAIFQGPHAYVSPRWYASDNMVPTWNYIATHIYGRPRIIEDFEETKAVLKTLTDFYEAGAETPWEMESLSDRYMERRVPQLMAFEMPIERMETKHKLSQNRKAEDIRGAAAGLRAGGSPDELAVADLMEAALDQG